MRSIKEINTDKAVPVLFPVSGRLREDHGIKYRAARTETALGAHKFMQGFKVELISGF